MALENIFLLEVLGGLTAAFGDDGGVDAGLVTRKAAPLRKDGLKAAFGDVGGEDVGLVTRTAALLKGGRGICLGYPHWSVHDGRIFRGFRIGGLWGRRSLVLCVLSSANR